MDFSPRSGCPMCGIVAKGLNGTANSPVPFSPPLGLQQQQQQSTSRARNESPLSPEILWRDDNFTVYRERAYPVSSKGHIIIVFNLHVPSLYTLSSSDVPLLVSLRSLAHRFLTILTIPPSSPLPTPIPISSSSTASSSATLVQSPQLYSSESSSLDPSQTANFKVGFITPPWRDSAIPCKDHLHAHAYVAPRDRCGWMRSVAFGPLAWYGVDDLIAEIRESSSNNRIRSGVEGRGSAPIDRVADAGARSGTADGVETTDTTLASNDIESGSRHRGRSYGPPERMVSYASAGSDSSMASGSGLSGGSALLSPPPPSAVGSFATPSRPTTTRRVSAGPGGCLTPSPRASMSYEL